MKTVSSRLHCNQPCHSRWQPREDARCAESPGLGRFFFYPSLPLELRDALRITHNAFNFSCYPILKSGLRVMSCELLDTTVWKRETNNTVVKEQCSAEVSKAKTKAPCGVYNEMLNIYLDKKWICTGLRQLRLPSSNLFEIKGLPPLLPNLYIKQNMQSKNVKLSGFSKVLSIISELTDDCFQIVLFRTFHFCHISVNNILCSSTLRQWTPTSFTC